MIGQFLHHGGRVAEAARLFGGAVNDWLDLSTGLNPRPWPVPVDLMPDWHALPDPEALAALESVAARHFGIDPSLCCAVPGSEAALRQLARLLDLPGRALVPAYRSHLEAFAQSRPAHFGEEPKEREVFVMANPNNPDGVLRSSGDVLDWSARIERQAGWLIVDEAFADCRADTSVAGAVTATDRLLVLRSFGKFFGLAGVRLGFVLGPAHVLGALRQAMGSWPIHTGALAIGTRAYADADWIAETRQVLPLRAERMDRILRRHGLEPLGSCPLFRLVTGCAAGEVFERLGRAHILVRPFEQCPDWLRFGVPAEQAALARLDAALGHG